MNTTKILGEAVGIQRQDIIDQTEEQLTDSLSSATILGRFRRGRLDKPMAIHQGNIRGQLGYDPKNPDYIAVQDCLDIGVPSVQVLRVNNSKQVAIQCVGATEKVSLYISLYWIGESGGVINIYNDETNEVISEIQGYFLDFVDYNMANRINHEIDYIELIAETTPINTEYDSYRLTQQLLSYRNISATPLRLRIEVINIDQVRFPKTYITEETEFHSNSTFFMMEEDSQRVVYGVCLAPMVKT